MSTNTNLSRRVFLVVALVVGGGRGSVADDTESLFADLRFRRGFLLSHTSSSKGRAVAATFTSPRRDRAEHPDRPVWRLCQWGTRHSLADAVPVQRLDARDGDAVVVENRSKRVVFDVAERPDGADLVLDVSGGEEYGDRARRAGEAWPHLLVEQDARANVPLASLESLRLRVDVRLVGFADRMGKKADAGLHAAQFQLFLIVKCIAPNAPDRGNYIWFGMPFFDSRHEFPPPYRAKDAGKSDATGKFIYTIDGRKVLPRSLRDSREWVKVDVDLLPSIRSGLDEAVRRGYLKRGDPKDYAAVNMNMGWEMPGAFDASVAVRRLDVTIRRNSRAETRSPRQPPGGAHRSASGRP